MGRLSNTTRESMAVALVKHRFNERATALIGEARDLFRKLYDDHYPVEVRKHMAALDKKYTGAFAKRDDLTANVDGRLIEVGDVTIGLRDAYWKFDVEARPVLNDQNGYRSTIGIAVDHPLAARLIAFADEREILRCEIEPARKEALGALQQFTTGKRLGEDWPEAMPVIGSLIPEDDRTLPVVQVANLNAKFDLPPSERRAA